MKKFPCPETHWLFGNILQIYRPNEAYMKLSLHHANTFKTCFVYWFSIFPVLVCCHNQAIREIVKNSVPKGNWVYGWVRPWLGRGLVFESGARWARNRKLLTPLFSRDLLKTYIKVYNGCTDILIHKWKLHATKGDSFDEYDDFALLSFDVMLQCSFSLRINCQTTGKNHLYVEAIKRLTLLIIDRLYTLPHYIEFVYRLSSNGREFYRLCDYVHDFGNNIIEHRRKFLLNNSKESQDQPLDFLDILLTARDKDGKGLKMKEIREEVDTFMFAGHHTTASALAWTIYCLAKYKTCQDKVREEVDKILDGKDDVEWDDLSQFNYTLQCIKEAMRMYTTVPDTERKLNRDMEIDGKLVPAGTVIHLKMFLACNREDVWHNPQQYNPDRFSPENSKDRDPYQYLPFFTGQRNCIGQNFAINELKVAVAKIIHNFELDIDAKHKARRYHAIVLRPETGLWITVKKRR